MSRRASGGLGNQLFQYHFLRRSSEILCVPAFNRGSRYSRAFVGLERRDLPVALASTAHRGLTVAELDTLGWVGFLEWASWRLARGRTIVLAPGILGSQYFESAVNPTALIDFRVPLGGEKDVDSARVRVGFHLRGGDFFAWDRRAVLPTSYYLDAWDYVRGEIRDQPNEVVICTDDPSLDAVSTLESATDVEARTSADPVDDMRALASCDWIVASPSTFAIWAGILGPRTLSIQSRQWVEMRANEGAKFWADMAKQTRSSPSYRLAALI